MIVRCLFEQSGTFKNEFKKLGIDAYDYDICDTFEQTDYQLDLFKEIENAYHNRPSIFEHFTSDDLIMAFFPCIRFEDQCVMLYKGTHNGTNHRPLRDKLEKDIRLHNELHYYYTIITYLTIVCIDRNFKLIIENPYSTQHYLRRYWAFEPKIIDMNRKLDGDYYEKPTQYWFLNCEPEDNFIFEPLTFVEKKNVAKERGINRSLIHPQYAERFIKRYILKGYVSNYED